jgi:hypothetical protein
MSSEGASSLRDAAARLGEVADAIEQGIAERAQLDDVIADLRAAAVREFGPRPAARRGDGGKNKILEYLQAHLGEWVHGEELAAAGGIQEWARRTREWRTEEGYDIDEEGGYYRLNALEPDAELAARWKLANEIRRRPGSATSRLLEYLIANESKVVTRDELDYVAKIKEGSRRVRELRDEQGRSNLTSTIRTCSLASIGSLRQTRPIAGISASGSTPRTSESRSSSSTTTPAKSADVTASAPRRPETPASTSRCTTRAPSPKSSTPCRRRN